jgi:hypothetical protein
MLMLLSTTPFQTKAQCVSVGDNIQGGIVFYVDNSGTGGLVAAPTDLSAVSWGCQGTSITGANGTSVGTGFQNTTDIDGQCATAGIAAKLCLALNTGGYSDWYLPSTDELNLLYGQKATVGGFGGGSYWSSTQVSANNAYGKNFTSGIQTSILKNQTQNVRAIRSFSNLCLSAAALHFDGVNDYISLGNSALLKPTAALTVEVWLSESDWSSLPANKTIIGNTQNGGYSLQMDGGILKGWIRRNGTYGISSYNITSLSSGWHHLAMTFDGRYNRLYVDCNLVSTNDAGANYAIQYSVFNNSTIVGAEAFEADTPEFNSNCAGLFDELRIWSTAKNCNDLCSRKSCELAGNETNLLAYYTFNQGFDAGANTSETSLSDETTNQIDGTLHNFTLNGVSSNWIAPGAVLSGNACTGSVMAPEINVLGNAISITDGAVSPNFTDSTDFGNVITNTNSVRTFSIQNTGSANLNISALSVTGADAALFSASTLTPASPITPGNAATFTITFLPTNTGIKNATLHIANDDCDESDYDFAIKGTAQCNPPTVPVLASSSLENCGTQATTLSVSAGQLNDAANWEWYKGSCGGTPVGSGSSIIVSPSVTTTYFARGEGGCINLTCAQITIVVKTSAPTASVVVPSIGGLPATACDTTSANLYIPNVTNATSYTWDGPLGCTFNGFANSFATTTPAVTIVFGQPNGSGYYIGVQAGNACGNSLRKVQWVRGIVSVPSKIVGSTTRCQNSGPFLYRTPKVEGASSYNWSITGDATVSGTDTNAYVTFGPAWNGGSLCVEAKTNCYTSPSKCLTITRSVGPLSNLTGSSIACPNTNNIPYNVGAAGDGAAFYNWSFTPALHISGSSTTNNIGVNFGPNFSSGNICVSVTSICGVTSPSICKSVVTGIPNIPTAISGFNNGICNQNVAYNAVPSVFGNTYNWTAPGSISGNGNSAVMIQYGQVNTGQVCVSATNACGTSGQRCIAVKGAPNTPASITAIPSSWCANTAGIYFEADVTNVKGVYTLAWTYPQPPIATYLLGGGNTNDLTLNWGIGNGTITVTATNACGTGTKTFNAVVSCREDNFASNDNLDVYPNPTEGKIEIHFSAKKGVAVIKVSDLSGRLLQNHEIVTHDGKNTLQLDLHQFAKGTYLLAVQHADENQKAKIIVQ